MAFKDDVEYFLKKGDGLNYYGLDVNTCNIAEDDEGGDEGGDEGDASKSTEKTCPCCGKKKCECDASKSTGTKGGDDDNDGNASVATDAVKVAEAVKKLREAGVIGQNFHATTPEEKKLVLALAEKCNASVATDELKVAEAVKKLRAAGVFGSNFRASTPEEKKLALALAESLANSKASMDDKGAGFAPSVNTTNIKEEILKRL